MLKTRSPYRKLRHNSDYTFLFAKYLIIHLSLLKMTSLLLDLDDCGLCAIHNSKFKTNSYSSYAKENT